MLGLASSSQHGGSFSASGALSHVYVQHPPLRCRIPGSRGLFYDDANKLLIGLASDQVFSWKTVPFAPTVAPLSDTICQGPVLSIRYSLDAKVIGVQRSTHEIEFLNRETGEMFSQRCRPESDPILGFFWTDCPLCDIVIVKTSGMELFSYNSEIKSLYLMETKRMNVSWYVYMHESRLVLLSSGMQCKKFNGFQLSSAGIIRLPKFEMSMAKSDANSKPVLAAEDVHIATVYGRIYCLQVDRIAMLLHMYRFYRDAVVQQGSLPIYSSKIGVSVVDNVLLIHQVDAKVVILYDIFADSRAPISAPLPLLLRGLPRASSSSIFNSRDAERIESNDICDHEAIIYGDDWIFLVPDLICDAANGFLWKIFLDLEAICASSSEVASMLEFLQRRKLEASKAKKLCLTAARSVILERRPVSTVARALDVLVTTYSYSIKSGNLRLNKAEQVSTVTHVDRTGAFADESTDSDEAESGIAGRESSTGTDINPASSYSRTHGSKSADAFVTTAAISPDEMYSFVFSPVEEEISGDPSYLVAIIVEYIRSSNCEKVKVHPKLYVMTVQLLARNERFMELGSFIINKIIEPSNEVAFQLLESGCQNFPTRKLGLDMLRQLSLHHDYVLVMVQDGHYLEALRYARKKKVESVRPLVFLEAASSSNDSQLLAAVLRFFSDFIPGFSNASEHGTYCRILSEMKTSIAS